MRAAIAAALHPWKAAFWEWRYRALARGHALPIYDQAPSDRIASEIAFADAWRQVQQAHDWIPRPLYPVGGAANPAFLTILTRALTENHFECVFEFGGGQTTPLLSQWSKVSGGKVFTFEDNAVWAERCRAHIASPNHHVLHAPLARENSGWLWYDLAEFRRGFPGERADLIIVDGPMGTPRYSRDGFITAFPELRREEWAVLWDDLNRYGDLESAAAFIAELRRSNTPFDLSFCQAFRTLGLIVSPCYSALRYYC